MNLVDDVGAITQLSSRFSLMDSATEPNDKDNPIEINDEDLAPISTITLSSMTTDEAPLPGYYDLPRSSEPPDTQSLRQKERKKKRTPREGVTCDACESAFSREGNITNHVALGKCKLS